MRPFLLLGLFSGWLALAAPAPAQPTNPPPKKQILFVCTGNYYRSRFAEALFNYKARQAQLGWQAVSRGLKLVASQQGLSPLAQKELVQRGVPPELWKGAPKALTNEDLAKSDYIVLLDEAEHRPLLEQKFSARDPGKLHYWHIGESGQMKPPLACRAMASGVEELLKALGR